MESIARSGELANLWLNEPLNAGDTISHATVQICCRKGWAKKDSRGRYVLTRKGNVAFYLYHPKELAILLWGVFLHCVPAFAIVAVMRACQ